MIKRLLLVILLSSFTITAYAEKHYVYIDKIGHVEKGQEAGHNEYGDVVAICPYTPQYKPTKAERARYKVIVTDLTEEEKAALLEPEQKPTGEQDQSGQPIMKIIRARKRKINLNRIMHIKQEASVAKGDFVKNIMAKPVLRNNSNE